MISTGKKARKQFGTRAACKRARGRRPKRKEFGSLPVSFIAGNHLDFIRKNSGVTKLA